MDNKIILGSRYFKYDEDTDAFTCYRVTGFQNSDTLRVTDVNTKEKKKISRSEILDDYYLLKPDGFMHFNVVTMPDPVKRGKEIYDVVITLYTKDELSSPYLICRQNIADPHANVVAIDSRNTYRGCCITRDTCPANLVFDSFLMCNKLEHTQSISVYIDDKLNDILECVKAKEFNKVLDIIWEDYVSVLDVADRNYVETIPNFLGYCKNLKELMEYNMIMDDFVRAFGCIKLDRKISVDQNGFVDPESLEKLKIELNQPLLQYSCIKYDKDIELDKIKLSYQLVADGNYDIYLIVYQKYDNLSESFINSSLTNAQKLNIINKLTNK